MLVALGLHSICNVRGDLWMSKSWHQHFIDMAQLVADKSKDRSTKVGAVIVGPENEVRSTGYNGFPRKVNDNACERHLRPEKYDYTEHAERNAIYNAARVGIPLSGCTLYLNWTPIPCPDCTRALIQSGISRIVGPDRTFPNHGKDWHKTFEHSMAMIREAGVTIEVMESDET